MDKENNEIDIKQVVEKLSSLTYTDALREGKYIGERQGKRIGEAQKTVNSIKSLIKTFNFSTEKAMQGLEIPLEQQGLYYQLVNDPVFYEKYFADESNFYDPSDYIDEDFEENEEDYYDDEE